MNRSTYKSIIGILAALFIVLVFLARERAAEAQEAIDSLQEQLKECQAVSNSE